METTVRREVLQYGKKVKIIKRSDFFASQFKRGQIRKSVYAVTFPGAYLLRLSGEANIGLLQREQGPAFALEVDAVETGQGNVGAV